MSKADVSVHTLQESYQELFAQFNREYFDGRIAEYRVVVHEPTYRVDGVSVVGECHRRERRIDLSAVPLPGGESLLLHEMVHAATGPWHGRKFRNEVERLVQLGAPILEGARYESEMARRRRVVMNRLGMQPENAVAPADDEA